MANLLNHKDVFPRAPIRFVANFHALFAIMVTVISPTGSAAATPEDPYGSDYVAVAVSPSVGIGTAGRSGTLADAAQIALAECTERAGGNRCAIARATQYGCVAFAIDTSTGNWSGGIGRDETSAAIDAARNMPNGAIADRMGARCSDPINPP